jgi:acylphosphatase
MQSIHAVLRGRVQGVGYRAFVLGRAREFGVHGEVRNTADGCVEVIAEGDMERLESFLAEVREGPVHARVEHVELRANEGTPRYRSFSITG